MASLYCLVAASLLGYAVSRRLMSGVTMTLALAVPLAAALLLVNERFGGSAADGWTAAVMGGLALVALLWGPGPKTMREQLFVSPALYAVSLLLLAALLHLGSTTFPADAWRRHALISLQASGEEPGLFFYSRSGSGYERLVASLLPPGGDPLLLEWATAPLLMIASFALLSYLCFLCGKSPGGAALLSGLAFLVCWEASAPPLLLVWHGATPLAVTLLLGGGVVLARLWERPREHGESATLVSPPCFRAEPSTWAVRLLEVLAVGGIVGLSLGYPTNGWLPEKVWPSLGWSFAFVGVAGMVLGAANRLGSSRARALLKLSLVAFSLALLSPAATPLAENLARVWAAGGWPRMLPVSQWRVGRPELGLELNDIDLAKELALRRLPGEKVLTNLGDAAVGIAPASVVVALSGVPLAGWQSERLGWCATDFAPDSLSLALAASGRADLLWNSGVSWLLLSPRWESLERALAASPQARLEASRGEGLSRRNLWRLEPSPSLAVSRTPSQPPFRSRVVMLFDEGARSLARLEGYRWTRAAPYTLQISAFNEQKIPARLGWLALEVSDATGKVESRLLYLLGATPLAPGTGDLQEVVLVTPKSPGRYRVRGRLLTAAGGSETLFEFPLLLSKAPSRDCDWGVESLSTPLLELMTGAQTQL